MTHRDSRSEILDFGLRVIRKTEKAVLVTEGLLDDEHKEIRHWLPFSQIEPEPDEVEEGTVCAFQIPRWLAEEKSLTIS